MFGQWERVTFVLIAAILVSPTMALSKSEGQSEVLMSLRGAPSVFFQVTFNAGQTRHIRLLKNKGGKATEYRILLVEQGLVNREHPLSAVEFYRLHEALTGYIKAQKLLANPGAYCDFPIILKREQKGEEVSARICVADLTAGESKMIQDWLELARKTASSP